MSYNEDIDKALMAHGLWRKNLRDAIISGDSKFEVAKVKTDNQCDFGKWFYSLPASMRDSEQGKSIQKLHAAFHAEVGRVLQLALDGKKEEATKATDMGSNFMNISGQLSLELTSWKRKIAA